ncbi:hypothetical protein [Roseateles sp. LKC17W]|uniref:Tetratricopeptide repeat protein n=1 Tax=Pelomonas margarita TaxID=3299031 RepID=A0ABW7FPG0_9BURK
MKTLKTVVAVAVGALALTLNGAPGAEFGLSQASAQETVRKEVGGPLGDASKLYKAGKHKEALAKLRDADAVANRTPGENFAIEGLRFSAAMGAGDADTMTRAFDVLKAKLGGPQQLQYMEAIAGTYLRANNAPKALEWANKYFAAGGSSATVKQVQQQAQFKSGDMTAVLKDTLAEIQSDEKSGRAPTQDKLNILLFAAQKKGDLATESYAVERLLNYYPRKELWAQVLGGLQGKKGFAARFSLDVYRLQLATGNLKTADDYMEMAQLAAQAGYPDEGKKVVEQGLAANILGQGAEGARHKRLLDLMVKKSNEAKADAANAEKVATDARTGDELVKLGLSRVFAGDKAGGLKLVDAGVAKGNFTRADDVKFYQGLAYFNAGEGSKAQSIWRGVKGTDGSGELARLWGVHARSAKK